MAHFAKLDQNNLVLAVHVVVNDVIIVDGQESEQAGINFLTQLHGYPYWKQTSYNATFRKHYAGIGYTYDETLDAFIPPKPYPSWLLDTDTCNWYAPVPYPNDGNMYQWDEATQQWILIESP